MSAFNLENQNAYLDYKIVAGLERLSQVFRVMLWEKAQIYGLSPIQIQVLIFIRYHEQQMATVTYLSKEFNVTKPTISDAIKVLQEKKLIKKVVAEVDTRSYSIRLTEKGKLIVMETETFTEPFAGIINKFPSVEKENLWATITTLIKQLNKAGLIKVQRMCFTCKHYKKTSEDHFCTLLNLPLQISNIRIDCPEHDFIYN